MCAALAAAGLFYIQKQRLRLERARVIASLIELVGGRLEATLTNAGMRSAFDIRVQIRGFEAEHGLEALIAGSEQIMHFEQFEMPVTLVIAYTDDLMGRRAESRGIELVGGRLVIHPPESCPAPSPAGGVLPSVADARQSLTQLMEGRSQENRGGFLATLRVVCVALVTKLARRTPA